MHWEKPPKEQPCYALPTVKELLEKKRKKEESSASASRQAAATSPVPPATIPQLPVAAPPSSADVAVSFQQWGSAPDCPGQYGYTSASFSTSPGVSYAASFSPPMAASYSPQPHIQGFGDAMMPQTFEPPAEGPAATSLWLPSVQPGFAGPRIDFSRLEEARMLLSAMDSTSTSSQDEDGDTILHIYAAKGLRECAYVAAEKLRDLGRLEAKEHKGKTALLVGVAANQPHIVQDLLSLGADVNTCDDKGQTSLHLAAYYGFPAVLQVILSASSAAILEARNFEGMTPLHCAALAHCSSKKPPSGAAGMGDVQLQSRAEDWLYCLKMLLGAGASVLNQEIKSNKTVLHLAVKEGNLDLVRYLMKLPLPNMAEFVNMKAHGHTALHMAAGLHGNSHQEEILRLLLSRGADPSIRNLENDQAAHLLQSGPQGEQLKLILKRRSASARRRVASLQDRL